jgi:hypothetical protein
MKERLDRKPLTHPAYDNKFDGAPTVYGTLVQRLEIEDTDIGKPNEQEQDLRKIFFSSYDELLRTQEIVGFSLTGENKPPTIFANFVGSPAYDPNNKNASYTETYYEGTGLNNILKQMEVKTEKIAEIRQSYENLDKDREDFLKQKEVFFEKYPSLKNLNVEFYYILGKEGGNVLVANIKSPWYAMTPDAVPAGPEYHPHDGDAPYTSVPAQDLQKALADPGKITVPFVVVDGRGQDRKQDDLFPGKKATRLPLRELDSPFSGDLKEIQVKRGEALFENIQGKIDQQAEEELKKATQKVAAVKPKKEVVAENKKKQQDKKNLKETIEKAITDVNSFLKGLLPPGQPSK